MARKHDKTELPKLAKVSAFFSTPTNVSNASILQYPIEQLVAKSDQPRRYFDAAEITQLAESIKHCGVLEPLLVEREQDGCRQILAGERRWRAARQAGLTTVPVYELNLPPTVLAQVPLIENLLRRDLSPFEELEGYLALLAQNLASVADFAPYTKDVDAVEGVVKLLFAMRNAHAGRRNEVNENLVQQVEEIFRAIGSTSWRSFVSHRLPLRKLPADVQLALHEGWLDYTKAVEIGRLLPERLGSEESAQQARTELLAQVRTEQIPIREIKARVSALLNVTTPKARAHDQQVHQQVRKLFTGIKRSYAEMNEQKRQRLSMLLEQMNNLLNE